MSEWVAVIIYAFLIYEMWSLWTAPTGQDLPRISTFAVLMGFEFILVHSAVFMALMPRRVSLLFLVPVYGVLAVLLNTATDNNIILYLYLGLIFTRMRFAFSNVTKIERRRVIKTSIIAAVIYLTSIGVIAVGEDSLPEKGVTQEFLNAHNYFDTLSVGGIFTECPHLPLIMGIIYFSLLFIFDVVRLVKRKGNEMRKGTESS